MTLSNLCARRLSWCVKSHLSNKPTWSDLKHSAKQAQDSPVKRLIGVGYNLTRSNWWRRRLMAKINKTKRLSNFVQMTWNRIQWKLRTQFRAKPHRIRWWFQTSSWLKHVRSLGCQGARSINWDQSSAHLSRCATSSSEEWARVSTWTISWRIVHFYKAF